MCPWDRALRPILIVLWRQSAGKAMAQRCGTSVTWVSGRSRMIGVSFRRSCVESRIYPISTRKPVSSGLEVRDTKPFRGFPER
jgi:hypothetical protein